MLKIAVFAPMPSQSEWPRHAAADLIADLFENVSLSTGAEEYVWVNRRQVWGVGTVNFAVGKIHIDAYMQ